MTKPLDTALVLLAVRDFLPGSGRPIAGRRFTAVDLAVVATSTRREWHRLVPKVEKWLVSVDGEPIDGVRIYSAYSYGWYLVREVK